MIPLILIGATAWLIKELAKETQKPVSQFDETDIITDYVKYFKSSEITEAKRHSTRVLNTLVLDVKKFKVGKSGSPSDRNSQHKNFNKMYLIVESNNEKLINELEAYQNEKFISHKKNKNKKIGSAGSMTDKKGKYFLYLIAN
jgi:hypothetical protein